MTKFAQSDVKHGKVVEYEIVAEGGKTNEERNAIEGGGKTIGGEKAVEGEKTAGVGNTAEGKTMAECEIDVGKSAEGMTTLEGNGAAAEGKNIAEGQTGGGKSADGMTVVEGKNVVVEGKSKGGGNANVVIDLSGNATDQTTPKRSIPESGFHFSDSVRAKLLKRKIKVEKD